MQPETRNRPQLGGHSAWNRVSSRNFWRLVKPSRQTVTACCGTARTFISRIDSDRLRCGGVDTSSTQRVHSSFWVATLGTDGNAALRALCHVILRCQCQGGFTCRSCPTLPRAMPPRHEDCSQPKLSRKKSLSAHFIQTRIAANPDQLCLSEVVMACG